MRARCDGGGVVFGWEAGTERRSLKRWEWFVDVERRFDTGFRCRNPARCVIEVGACCRGTAWRHRSRPTETAKLCLLERRSTAAAESEAASSAAAPPFDDDVRQATCSNAGLVLDADHVALFPDDSSAKRLRAGGSTPRRVQRTASAGPKCAAWELALQMPSPMNTPGRGTPRRLASARALLRSLSSNWRRPGHVSSAP